jgi:hypothetical protein
VKTYKWGSPLDGECSYLQANAKGILHRARVIAKTGREPGAPGVSESHKKKGGRHLDPYPGTDTNDSEKRSGILTHSCQNPFSDRKPAPGKHYCSEGCITAYQSDIDDLNKLLDAEPGSILYVTSIAK